MQSIRNIVIVALLVIAVGVVVAIKQSGKTGAASVSSAATAGVSEPPARVAAPMNLPSAKSIAVRALPKLVDLGATKCIPCKMMAPILEDLKKNYAGQIDVQFIDVWEKPDAGGPYGIKIIPTQIFFDAEGKELFRHEGFFSKENILGKWRELGVKLDNNAVVRSQHPE